MSNFININNIFKSVYGDIKKEMITNSKYLFMKHKIFKSYNKIFKKYDIKIFEYLIWKMFSFSQLQVFKFDKFSRKTTN